MSLRKVAPGDKPTKERDALSSPLEEILKRLDAIERRLTKLEASPAASNPRSEASNAAAFKAEPAPGASSPAPPVASAPPVPALTGTAASPIASMPPAAPVDTPPIAPTVAVGSDPKSYSPTATAPATERLHPLSTNRAGIDSPFPDLSMLDEKLEPRRGPAEQIDVRAAIEDYPRICSRIQQLWGSPECEAYVNNLVIDTRGNRKGFPPAVMEELLYLGRLARALVILSINGDLWDTLDQVGDRR